MANEQETVADIVREMRNTRFYEQTSATAGHWVRNFADRIEAAFVRNNDEYNCELTRLREALRYCVKFIGDAAEPLGADCETVEKIGQARELLKGVKND